MDKKAMAPKAHALLGASSAHRWIHCPPSARLSEQYPDATSEFALEGTDAHALCEYKLRTALGQDAGSPVESLDYYNQEMEESADGYVEYVMELVEGAKESCPDTVALVEQRVDYSRWVPEGFGTADCIIIADGTLHVVDFKYGLGVLVNAEMNPQMMCYALGALDIFDVLYNIRQVSMHIYQPRRDNVSTYTVSRDELLKWADETLKPAAELAYNGEGEYNSGEWCTFCKARSDCRARAEKNMELARYEFKQPPQLTDEEVADILAKVDSLVAWADDIKNYALQQAISGKHWPGFKLVEGRSNRKYTNEAAVAKTVLDAGYSPYEEKLLGITAMEKMLGKARFNKLLSNYVEKPQGKPTLAPESDKRPEMSTVKAEMSTVKADFYV